MNILLSLAYVQLSLISLQLQVNQLTPSQTLISAPQQEIVSLDDTWLVKLQMCESGGNDKALNPKDTDGTPSKGRYQFKDGTFAWLSKKYNIPTTSIWNGDDQTKIVRKMMHDKDINLHKQFPGCTSQIGLPSQDSS